MAKLTGAGSRLSSEVSTLVRDAKDAILRNLPVAPRLLVLYGSEARGEGTPESDIDLLVVLDEQDPETVDRIHEAIYSVMWDHDFSRIISVSTMARLEFERQRRKGYSFVRNVEQDGIVLWRAA